MKITHTIMRNPFVWGLQDIVVAEVEFTLNDNIDGALAERYHKASDVMEMIRTGYQAWALDNPDRAAVVTQETNGNANIGDLADYEVLTALVDGYLEGVSKIEVHTLVAANVSHVWEFDSNLIS